MISALSSLVVRVALALATIVFVLGLMAVAVVTMLVVVVFSLLSGKKPKIDVSGFKRAQQFRAGAPRRTAGEVIDVEAREVSADVKRGD